MLWDSKMLRVNHQVTLRFHHPLLPYPLLLASHHGAGHYHLYLSSRPFSAYQSSYKVIKGSAAAAESALETYHSDLVKDNTGIECRVG